MDSIPVPPSTLPEMSAQEASWHEHLAGLRAADTAREQGSDTAATEALASATAGPTTIAGRPLQQATQGTIWTLQRVAREYARWARDHGIEPSASPDEPGTRELIELGLATLVFCDARACWRELDVGNLALLISRAEDMMWRMPLSDQMALQAHFATEMDRIRHLSGGPDPEPKKKPLAPLMPPGPSNEMPIPPPAQASPPSSGSPPNTACHSRMPFGPPPSSSPSSYSQSEMND